MKEVKIVRATRGNEEAAATEIAGFYNEMAEKGARTSRAIITAAGDDVVYTVFADTWVGKDDADEDISGDGSDNEVDGNDDDGLEDADDDDYDV